MEILQGGEVDAGSRNFIDEGSGDGGGGTGSAAEPRLLRRYGRRDSSWVMGVDDTAMNPNSSLPTIHFLIRTRRFRIGTLRRRWGVPSFRLVRFAILFFGKVWVRSCGKYRLISRRILNRIFLSGRGTRFTGIYRDAFLRFI